MGVNPDPDSDADFPTPFQCAMELLVLVAVPLAVLVCRRRIAQRKELKDRQIIIAAVGAFLVLLVIIKGSDLLTRAFWANSRNLFIGYIFLVCLVPSGFVIGYYRWKNRKKDQL